MLEHGENLARQIGAEKNLAMLNLLISRYYAYHGGQLESNRYLENSLQKALKIEDVEIVAQTAFGLSMLHYTKGDLLKIADVALPVIDLLEKTNDTLTLGFCEYMYGALLNLKHEFKPAITHLHNALSFFEKVKFKAMLGLALSHLVSEFFKARCISASRHNAPWF